MNLTLYQGNNFINLYKILFYKHYALWIKDLIPLSIEGTPYNTSNFA